MLALIVVDAQNEFSPEGKRPVPNHAEALSRIASRVEQARLANVPIAWLLHHNLPHESPAFVPGTWGAQLSPGLGPRPDSDSERIFTKEVFSAFSNPELEPWLRKSGVTEILFAGFSTHMCLSTSSRDALQRGFDVYVDPNATAACDLEHELLGRQTADEVRRTALLHLSNMGAKFVVGADLPSAAKAMHADQSTSGWSAIRMICET